MHSSPVSGIYLDSASHQRQAESVGQRLRLPVLLQRPQHGPYLSLGANGLELVPANGIGPVRVDFARGPLEHGPRSESGRRRLIARAIGLKGGAAPDVLDATAGLGRDACILASLGCRVRMIERSPIIAALLEDGLSRAAHDAEAGAGEACRMSLVTGDAITLLEQGPSQNVADVIYLDPMYPKRKSAFAKKEMQVFRSLIGSDDDAPRLLEVALEHAGKRVVVKRPRTAPQLSGPEPTMMLKGTRIRCDVYMVASMTRERR